MYATVEDTHSGQHRKHRKHKRRHGHRPEIDAEKLKMKKLPGDVCTTQPKGKRHKKHHKHKNEPKKAPKPKPKKEDQ